MGLHENIRRILREELLNERLTDVDQDVDMIYDKFFRDDIEKLHKTNMVSGDTFSHLGINATVKSDRYSLPIMYQIKATQNGESYLNGAFETYQIFRKVLKTVLSEDIYKLRFYVFAEVEDNFPMGKVNYYFNYYVHETSY